MANWVGLALAPACVAALSVVNDEGISSLSNRVPKKPDDDSWYDHPFDEYSAQCSHNTYLWGTQGNVVGPRRDSCNASTMTVALNLGYRCIELDVWPREHHEGVKVLHESLSKMTNSVLLEDFVEKIKEWCYKNDGGDELKLPIIISVENHATDTEAREDYMANVFKGSLGDRLVDATNFRRGTLLRALSSSGKRKIIIKSQGEYEAFKSLIAMPKHPKQSPSEQSAGGPYTSKSIEVSGSISNSELHHIQSALNRGALVRTYPSKYETHSGNYHPGSAFGAQAQMICVNFQGKCNGDKVCRDPVRGSAKGNDCNCERDTAADLERHFMTYGIDGYILFPLSNAAATAFGGL